MRAAALLFSVLCACGPSAKGDDDGSAVDAGGATADASGPGSGIDAPVADFSRVYAHTGDTLYRIDTTTLMPLLVGPFGTDKSVTDIAIDSDDRMLGITLDEIVQIDEETGVATHLADLAAAAPDFTSLSFVPVDLQQPEGDEKLVAANVEGRVFEIDPTTGAAQEIGAYGSTADGLIRSSGDIVAVRGVGILATVTIGDDLTAPDYLARIDPTTWAATPIGAGTGWDRIFGLAYWRGRVYGFVDDQTAGGSILELDVQTGAAGTVVGGALGWFGAGVATDAPIVD